MSNLAMTLTTNDLIQMIEEEMENYITEVALCHSKDTGHFEDCDAGSIYSLSKRGSRENNIDPKYVGRGQMTKKRKLKAKYGMNTSKKGAQCGRQTIDGDKKPKDKRCRDYSKGRYSDQREENSVSLVAFDKETPSQRRERIFPGAGELWTLANGIAETEVVDGKYIEIQVLVDLLKKLEASAQEKQMIEGDKSQLVKQCRSLGLKTQAEAFRSIIDSLNMLKKAQDGKLYEPEKSG